MEDNGLICKLKQKLERRDIDLKRVNEELRKVEELAVVACKGTSFEEGRQLAHLQAENHALQEHVANLNKHVENLQNVRSFKCCSILSECLFVGTTAVARRV